MSITPKPFLQWKPRSERREIAISKNRFRCVGHRFDGDHVRLPPTLTRRAPASAISAKERLGIASTFTGVETASHTARISSVVRSPGANTTSAPASTYACSRVIVFFRSGLSRM